ncbi:MAG: bifunctional diaminohydroxyphosphoribosylaminopyrimidine deaminase/5-amino-6-(5-phosphoribosylamino)uracil reductase RibD [bacterium]|nr:bifunctional diaminohydroxyphosphoribosylaminopyrimidine deaminase/5-amino-6-(5-phosphoribosylamino)uracil reductase RibD [bacterium]
MNPVDHHHMTAALVLARRNLGSTWPNPSVGCVLVRGGGVVGRGTTAPGGRPHGEAVALDMAGERASGATAYVALEPCAHRRNGSSCSDSLVRAGVERVVVPMTDPDPRTSGRGIMRLREAGIDVDVGALADEAHDIHAGFTSRIITGRPLVTLKVAASLDGRIATATGESQWITGRQARRAAHGLRLHHDAVLIGRGTADIDDPLLTCRLDGLEHRSPVRIVADSNLGLSRKSALVASAGDIPTWIVCGRDADVARKEALRNAHVDVIEVDRDHSGRVSPKAMMAALGSRGLTRLLVEGGAMLAGSLVRDDLVDRVAWFHAPLLLGHEAAASLAGLEVESLTDARRWRVLFHRTWGQDGLTVLASGDNASACSPVS